MGFNNFRLIQKNKNTFYIQDGIIRYSIYLKNFPSCICMKNNKLCKHIKYYFSEIIGLQQWKIDMLEIYEIKERLTGKDLEYKFITDTCLKYLEENDCGICLESLSKNELYNCKYCKKIVHYKCFKDWIKKNNNKQKCIYCNQEIILF